MLARHRRRRVVDELASASGRRRVTPGLVAEAREPDLKHGGGALRDLQALDWAGWARGDGGTAALVAGGYLDPEDVELLDRARALILDVRVALQRTTGGRGDVLARQEADSVAVALGAPSALGMQRALAMRARDVAWIARDVWRRLQATERGPLGRRGRRDRPLGEGVVLRDGEVDLVADASVDLVLAWRAAAAAARRDAPLARRALRRLGELEPDPAAAWPPGALAQFEDLLAQGAAAVEVCEALDHVGLWGRALPEWDTVRACAAEPLPPLHGRPAPARDGGRGHHPRGGGPRGGRPG